jgi:hypothetical protein
MPNITAQFWDVEFLKDRMQEEPQPDRMAQFEQDWKLAGIEAVRRVSNAVEYPVNCRSPRCRRARRCVDHEALCKQLAETELGPAGLQGMVEKLYARIQQERRAAVREGRPPRLHDAVTGPMI